MCTAFGFKTKDSYFGRNLDLDTSYGEEIVVIPREYEIKLRKMPKLSSHYAMIGMATVVGGVPLLYDGANECGIAMAGLNFPGNACYYSERDGLDNITSFEFIPWVLGKASNIKEARAIVEHINLVNIPFSEQLPPSPLHWIISDGEESFVVEAERSGMHIYDNSVGVLTNNPPFPQHITNLYSYRNLSNKNGKTLFANGLEFDAFCQGLGAVGLPGDVSSMSRFVRCAFNKLNSVCGENEEASVAQVFHILSSVAMTAGACVTPSGKCDITVYSAALNLTRGLYYYTTYGNSAVTLVDMHREDLTDGELHRFPLRTKMQITEEN